MTNKSKFVNGIYDFASILLTAVIAVGIIFTFVFKLSSVDGQSMENTLHHGDSLLITSSVKHFEVGDVIVTSQPNAYNMVLIKRVVATGGQTVSFNRYSGKLLVDGVPIDEPYIKEPMLFTDSMRKEFVVPEGCVFVMGDNRNNSADSRDSNIGFVDERYIMGKVIYKFGDTEMFNN